MIVRRISYDGMSVLFTNLGAFSLKVSVTSELKTMLDYMYFELLDGFNQHTLATIGPVFEIECRFHEIIICTSHFRCNHVNSFKCSGKEDFEALKKALVQLSTLYPLVVISPVFDSRKFTVSINPDNSKNGKEVS